jgi:hypothetical protein
MRAKEFIPTEKPRNFVAKNAKMGGAGQHKDKKKAEKQGDVKHKAKQFEGSLNEFSLGGDGGDDRDADPYRYPKPESYRRSVDFFSQFEADHFDREDFDDATGVFKGYWGSKQIAHFKFDNPEKAGSDDPGMGWYYEPETDSRSDNVSDKPSADNSKQRKQQELSMINAFLKSRQTPKPGSQIYSLMKRHGMAEGLNELSNEKLAQYKKAAGDQATTADKAGDYDKGHKRFKGIVKATNKQFDNDAKKNK